jgi:hypothetical protein
MLVVLEFGCWTGRSGWASYPFLRSSIMSEGASSVMSGVVLVLEEDPCIPRVVTAMR